jgi:UDP:flavonoid glycosyltransferase YjiC (YdhE family)
MLKKVYFTPYGVGLGHASRLITIAEKVQNNSLEVKFSSFGEAVDYISRCGYKCNQVPPVEFSWNSQGSFSLKNSISNVPNWFKNFTIQMVKEVELMIRFKTFFSYVSQIIRYTFFSSLKSDKITFIS